MQIAQYWIYGLVIVVGYGWLFYMRIFKHPFPDRRRVEFFYTQRKVTGRILKKNPKRLDGAIGSLEVRVTNDEMWIMAAGFVKIFASAIDLEYRVQLRSITEVDRVVDRVTIFFDHEDGFTS